MSESGNEKTPAPKNARGKLPHDYQRRYNKAQAHENVYNALLNAWLDIPVSFSPAP
jgi:hypothetical protein